MTQHLNFQERVLAMREETAAHRRCDDVSVNGIKVKVHG